MKNFLKLATKYWLYNQLFFVLGAIFIALGIIFILGLPHNFYNYITAAFGNDANAYLQHFVNYGMAEGRQGRASFNVYTYRDEHPELWEKFGDNLRGYYLWACGIPQ